MPGAIHPSQSVPSFPRVLPRAAILQVACGLALSSFLVVGRANAQSTPQSSPTPTTPSRQNPALPHVNTTVIVHGNVRDDYLSNSITAGMLSGLPLSQTPLNALAITQEQLSDQQARLLSDVVKNDASVGEDYAPVGYYGDYEIRGFPIDLATGLEINGMTIAGEQDVPLENKERVEILNGIDSVESGVASAGGVIDFVTKKPADIGAVDLATDHRGSALGDLDFGHLFGTQKQVGARVTLVGERIQSYVNDADGWRAMGSGAADWKLSPKAILNTDFEYQHKLERSVCGYQLLGGTTVPDLNRIYPSTMLGEQSWAKPNTFDTYNTGARMDYDLPKAWHAFAQGSFSHSLIDDNVVYAYGAPYDANGNVACPGAPNAPAYFFCPDGSYGIYDYRDPGELRIDAEAESLVTGQVHTGVVTHALATGGELFRRSVQQPGAPPPAAPATVQDGAVYTYVGSENIYQPIVAEPIEDPIESAGPRALWEDNHQSAGLVQDRVQLPGRIQLLAAGRIDSLRDNNDSLTATSPGTAPTLTHKLLWLPQYAASFSPVQGLMLYGNYSVMLSLGPQGPWWVDNSSQFLAPFFTREAEVGAKYNPGQRLLISGDYFHMRAPFFYPRVISAPDAFCTASEFYAPGDLCFESQGHETHDGVELSAEGKAANWIQVSASVAGIHAVSGDTGTPAFDSKQVINVPRVRTAFFADIALPHLAGLRLLPGWSYTASKEATRDDAVSVAGYNLLNLGARYTPGGEQGRVTFRLYADNITDRRYWKDTGASYGDTFIHLGAPTTVRLSAHYRF